MQDPILGSRTDALACALEDLGEFGWLILTDEDTVLEVSCHLSDQPWRTVPLAGTGWRLDLLLAGRVGS